MQRTLSLIKVKSRKHVSGNRTSSGRIKRKGRSGKRSSQTRFRFKTWGGKRDGAGRKAQGEKAGVPHRPRPVLARRFPVHITLRVVRGLPTLRAKQCMDVIRAALYAGSQYRGFRLVHFSVQDNHLHLLCEAKHKKALSRGMQGLCIRIAKRLNKELGRKGRVFADRFFSRILKTPQEVRASLAYVLNNRLRHIARTGGDSACVSEADPCSSGPWFDGWRVRPPPVGLGPPFPIAPSRTWLLSKGWMATRCGLIRLDEVPG